MPESSITRSPAFRYGMALALPLVALGLRLALIPLLGPYSPIMLFILSGAAAAWLGGLGPGLLAFLLGGFLGAWFFIVPYHSSEIASIAERTRLVSYTVVGVLISLMAETLHRSVRRARERKSEADLARFSSEASEKRMKFLADLTRELLASSTPERLVDTLCQKILPFVDADLFLNYLHSDPGARLHLNAKGGLPDDNTREMEELDVDKTICGAVARSGQAHVFDEEQIHADPRAVLIRSFGVRAYACHPLIAKGEVLGVLSFGTRKRSRFTSDDLELMKTVADYVALALQRASDVQALRESEERYRAFVATSHEAIWRLEFDEPIDTTLPVEEQIAQYFARGYYAEVNEALAKLYGFDSAAEVPGLRVTDTESKEHRETVESTRQFIETGYRRTGEISYERAREGTPRIFLNNYVGLVENQKLVRVWGSSLDVTAQKRAEDALRESEAALKAFYENSPACMGMIELGEDDLLHIYDNPAGCRLMGLPPGSTAGKWATELGTPPHVLQSWMHRFRECAAVGNPIKFDLAMDWPGQPRRWLSATVAALDIEPAQRPRFCYVSLDLTARHEFEQELARAKETAEAASRTKDEFLATLSHELRNPLNPVLLTASAELADGTLSPAQRELWQVVYRNVSLQARLIDDLLDLTRIAHRRLHMHRAPLDAHEVLRQAIQTVQPDLQAKRQVLSVEMGAKFAVMEGDAARIQQVFWNVLRNAVKFTPADGTLGIRTSNGGSDRLFCIEFSDSGMGLSPEEKDRIFEAFVQGDHARGRNSHAYGGLGLGLAISQEIVQSHGGRIWAESAGRNLGSKFIVELPLNRPNA
jgi:signal transduction histidine kinase/PAS domain-containing protein